MKFREWLAGWFHEHYWKELLQPAMGCPTIWEYDAHTLITALHEAAKDPASGVRVVEAIVESEDEEGQHWGIFLLTDGPGKAIVIWEGEE
jgi:hypothetical protein